VTVAADRAIDAGLDRLIALQDKQTGAFGDKYVVASTSFAGLAILASGEVYGRGERADAVARAVDYLLNVAATEPEPGTIFFTQGSEPQGQMHAHGMAMLFLAECYGTTTRDLDARIARALRGAIRTSLDAQTSQGGWGYKRRGQQDFGTDEASVTITQIEALRACRNAGFAVPADAIRRAVAYVRRSMTADGSCRYSLTMAASEASRTSFELTAAAVATLNAAGVYDSPELDRGMRYLRAELRRFDSPGRASKDFYSYGNFYAAQAMFQAGGEDWATWYPAMRKELIEQQAPGGGWGATAKRDPRGLGEAYNTASALLILEMPKRYLPIFAK
jgi:hypothetical protein